MFQPTAFIHYCTKISARVNIENISFAHDNVSNVVVKSVAMYALTFPKPMPCCSTECVKAMAFSFPSP